MTAAAAKQDLRSLPRFKTYPAYKDSGVEWLATIPDHWEVKPLKHLTTFVTGWTPPTGREDLYGGDYLWANIGDLGPKTLFTTEKTISEAAIRESRMRVAKAGSLLFSFKLSVGTVSLAGVDMYTNEAIAAFAPSERIDTGYLYWAAPVLVPQNAQDNIYGAPLLSRERIANALLLNAPLPEQRAIAAFLDRETERIDALVKKKERLIELLHEKRTALITEAVTKGVDPNAPLKDSGVQWMGEIPAHWDVKRVKDLSRFVTSGSRGWAEYYTDEGSLFLRIGNLRMASIDLDLSDVQHVTPTQGAEGERTRVRAGDVLISITALIGAVGVVSATVTDAFVNQHLALVRLADEQVSARWLGYCVLSRVGQEQLRAALYGGTKEGLSLDDIRSLVVLLPPRQEQQRIVATLDTASEEVDALVAKVRDAIDRLQELRTALISAAVTGKIDVREAPAS